jgi:hypothetical protein
MLTKPNLVLQVWFHTARYLIRGADESGSTPLHLVFLSGKVDAEITQLEGHFIPQLAFLRGQRPFRFIQVCVLPSQLIHTRK